MLRDVREIENIVRVSSGSTSAVAIGSGISPTPLIVLSRSSKVSAKTIIADFKDVKNQNNENKNGKCENNLCDDSDKCDKFIKVSKKNRK